MSVMKNTKIAVIGANGYIGSFLSSKFSELDNVDLYKCARRSSNNINNKKEIIGDITDIDYINRIVSNNFDVIIYTISLNHTTSEQSVSNSLDVNLMPFGYLLECVARKSLQTKVIYFSTFQLYSVLNQDEINENTPIGINNIYALTHYYCENLLNYYKKRYGIAGVNIRLTNSYGFPENIHADCWWLVINDLAKSAALNREISIMSDGTPIRDFISLESVYLSINKILKFDKLDMEVINICSGNTLSILEVANIIKNEFKNLYNIDIIIKINKNPETNKKNKKYLVKSLYLQSLNENLNEKICQLIQKIEQTKEVL
ncbi:MAG: hypothetical protein RLZZ546_1861 [Bacteroidota bacterium]|jgi:nucleoside-diphosphate-sugar epimerase